MVERCCGGEAEESGKFGLEVQRSASRATDLAQHGSRIPAQTSELVAADHDPPLGRLPDSEHEITGVADPHGFRDEIQALVRTAPFLSMLSTTPEVPHARLRAARQHEPIRGLRPGQRLGDRPALPPRRHQEFVRFLKLIDYAVPKDLLVRHHLMATSSDHTSRT